MIRVALAERGRKDVVAVTGRVIDSQRQPIPGRHVVVAIGGPVSDDPWHQATTDSQGRYRLREVVRTGIDGKPLRVLLLVTKEGYVGVESAILNGPVIDPDNPQVIAPIRLDRGGALGGVVVDHKGQPAVGASVIAIYYAPPGKPAEAIGQDG